jgi:hypothetical protein
MSSSLRRCLAIWLVLAAPAGLLAGTPRDELLRFVPEDVAFCGVVQDLRGHRAALLDSPFVEKLCQSALGRSMAASPEFAQLAKVEMFLSKHLGLTWTRLLDDVLGDAVGFAYRPGPAGNPQQDQGLFLVRSHQAKTLTDLVDRLNRVQKEAGELKELQEREHNGIKYYRRVDKKEPLYYHLRGPVLLFTAQEDMLRRALDQERTLSSDEPFVTGRLRELGMDRSLLAVWFNPRALDAAVDLKASQVQTAHADTLKTFAVCWKALEGVGLCVALDRDLSFSVAVRARPEKLPPSLRRAFTESPRPSDLWRGFPDNALLAVGGRIDLPAWFDTIGEFMSRESRQAWETALNLTFGAAIGKDFVREVLPAIGPDWGVCVTAPLPQEKALFPHVLMALRVSPGETTAPVDQTLLSAVQSVALLAVIGHNKQHPDQPISLKTSIQDKREVKYLSSERGLPPGLQPAFALQSGYLALASSPDLIRRFPFTAASSQAEAAGTLPLLRVSFTDWRAYLQSRQDPLAQILAQKDQLTQQEARQRLDQVISGLELLDRLEVRQRTTPGQITFTLIVQTAQPLKK